jgi:hypothetical protein
LSIFLKENNKVINIQYRYHTPFPPPAAIRVAGSNPKVKQQNTKGKPALIIIADPLSEGSIISSHRNFYVRIG